MATKVLVTGTSARQELLQPLVEAGCLVENPTHLLSENELKAKLAVSDAYLLGGDEYASRVALSAAKQLKVIAFLGMGYESFIDVAAAAEFGIPITNTPGTLTNSVAEFTCGLILSSTRRLFLYAYNYMGAKGGTEEKQHDLSNLAVGIVGLGAIGTRIAEILRNGFNARVAYHSRTPKPLLESQLGISYLPLSELSKEVDVLVVMTPGNEDTKGLIGANQIARFNNGLVLINTARADIVDPTSLLAGINEGKIGYAAFDGFYEQASELVDQLKAFIPSKLMVTGHIASLTHEARDGMTIRATQSILNILKTGSDLFIVSRKA